MAKSLLDEIKDLPPTRRNRTFRDTLTTAQQAEYSKVLKFVSSLPKIDRPTYSAVRILFLKEFGKAPGDATWRRDLEKAEYVAT